MTTTTTPNIQKAIDFLHAIEVAPGYYAYLAIYPRQWFVCDTTFLHDFNLALDGKTIDPFPESVSLTASRRVIPLPGWWSLQQCEVWRIVATPGYVITDDILKHRFRTLEEAYAVYNSSAPVRRITIDYATGKEIFT